ncbi:MAG: caspase family protein [Deltaproteobacteria bacterium]|nr:caspase family protein [Deltaproteobacteria bacterium]
MLLRSFVLRLTCAALIGASMAPSRVVCAADERRFAVVIGNDLGGNDTQPLLYARQDARRMKDVLLRVGAVKDENAISLLGADAAAVRAALADVERRVRLATNQGLRTALIVYYSGHAKNGDLRLGTSRLPLDELRARVSHSGATIRLGIIDACRSGAVTRSKGARRAPAFEIEATSNAQAEGTVFLSSSSFDEDAQESDHLEGSFFSHHFVNGLQGAADRSGDGRVTLSEAYAHAYAQTVASTADSAAGPQHPTFGYDLKGNGDFVLSEYARRNEGLLFPAAAPAGTYFVIDNQGVIAAEVDKPINEVRRIAVRPGRYIVKRRLEDRLRIGNITVAANQLSTVQDANLADAPFSDDPVKGAARDVAGIWSLNVGLTSQAFFDQPTREGLFPNSGLLAAELSVANFFRRHWVASFDVAAGGGNGEVAHFASAVPFRTNQLNLGTSLWTEWPYFDGDLSLFAGARVAFLFLNRRFEDDVLPAQHFSTFSPGLLAGARYKLTRAVTAMVRTRVHYLLYNVDENRSLGFMELGAAFEYGF